MNGESNNPSSSSIEDLHDEILTEILCRLPHKSAFLCKCVSKRWCSLISEPEFAVQSLNTNHTRTTPEWTFLIQTVLTHNCDSKLDVGNPSFSPRKFGLEFLPFKDSSLTVDSAFKDLVLCHTYNEFLFTYHVCNPQTKQWTSLPSSPSFDAIPRHDFTATLVCEDCYDYDNDKDKFTRWRNVDYRYRVVFAVPPEEYEYADDIRLVVFISETQEWIEINHVIPISELADPSMNKYDYDWLDDDEETTYDWFDEETYVWFQVVACNKIVYIRHGLQFGSFDPFNVTSDSNSTSFMAKTLPLPRYCHAIMESEGRLYSVFANNDTRLIIEELDPDADNNELPMRWKVIIQKSTNDCPSLIRSDATVVGVDPMSLDRVYVMMNRDIDRSGRNMSRPNLWLWSTGPGPENCSFKPLNNEISGTFISAHMLQLQCWPTPVHQVSQVSQKTMDTDNHRIYE